MARREALKEQFGEDLSSRIREAKLLVVGAGGIGCEVIKTLVLSGFENLEIVDLDTIEATNLNRQFLFSETDKGRPKSVVAAEAAQRLNPSANIKAHVGDLTDPSWGPKKMEKFDLVISALDNRRARTHLHRNCLAANRPVIESGTGGHAGQVTVHAKDRTVCFECFSGYGSGNKGAPSTVAICTIRQSPTNFSHCITWAKEYLVPEIANVFNPGEGIQKWKEVALKLLSVHFHDAIIEIIEKIKDSFSGRQLPTPLVYTPGVDEDEIFNPDFSIPPVRTFAKDPDSTWTFEESIKIFLRGSFLLFNRLDKESSSFDKDDAMWMDFVSSAAILRANIFHIDAESPLAVQKSAGNVEPAIAHTNAIISGLIVLNAYKILQRQWALCRSYMNLEAPFGETLISFGSVLSDPTTKCKVCNASWLEVEIDTLVVTIRDFVHDLLIPQLSLENPLISLRTRDPIPKTIYSCSMDETTVEDVLEDVLDDQPTTTVNLLSLTLNESGAVSNTLLRIEDPNLRAELTIVHRDGITTDVAFVTGKKLFRKSNTDEDVGVVLETLSITDNDTTVEVVPLNEE